jgi:hypothetical protein
MARVRPSTISITGSITGAGLALALTLCAGAGSAATVLNGSFEQPVLPDSWEPYTSAEMPGWDASGTSIELWQSGFLGVTSQDGAQHAELNGTGFGTVFQDIAGLPAEAALSFRFAHRGRNGPDTLAFALTDPGGDGAFVTGDDVALFAGEYTAGPGAWVVNAGTADRRTQGRTVRLSFETVATSGNRPSEGNLLDAVSLDVSVVPLPGGVPLLVTGLAALALLRGRARG